MKKLKDFIIKHKKEVFLSLEVIVILAVIVAVYISAASKKNKNVEETTSYIETTTEETTTEEVTETTVDEHENMAISKLTGDWVSKKVAKRRPVAIMINNISNAIPQAGIGEASVIYEAPVEGSLTRLMAIFEDYSDIERIGSIRSCRLYYCYFALEFDAIYMHFGQSKYAVNFLDSTSIDNVSGLSSIGNTVYYRSSDKVSPHNVYTTPDKVDAGIEALGYERKYDSDYEGKFTFTDEDNEIDLEDGATANTVSIGYPINAPWFEYDANTGLYKRFQYGAEHIDENTGEQLTCRNIIVQYVNASYYDDNKSLNMTVTGTGSGYYVTNGKAEEITWKKDSLTDITKYYDANGNEITLNIGKTWVCVALNGYSTTFSE